MISSSGLVLFLQTSLVGALSVGGGYTDNVIAAPDDTAAREGDSFAEVRPSLILGYRSERALHRLSYAFSASFFVQHSEANSYSNVLDYNAAIETSARTVLQLGASASEGRFNTFNLLRMPSTQAVGALPTGGFTYLALGAREGLTWDPTPRWRAIQGLRFSTFSGLGNDVVLPTSYDTVLDLRTDRSWATHALGAELRSDYTLFGETRAMGMVVVPRRQQIVETLLARWRHDLNPSWSSELDAGITTALNADDFGKYIVEFAGGAALRYRKDPGQAELAYTHGAQPNVFVGQSFVVDAVALRAGLPVWARILTLDGATGYSHGRAIDVGTGMTGSSVDVWLADAGLLWLPPSLQLAFALRYAHFQQLGASSGMVGLPSITRNVVLLTVSGAYPGQPAARGGGRAEGFEPGSRVDRSDETRPGGGSGESD